jgi:TatD DNase family protein
MNLTSIDSHSHIQEKEFDADRVQILKDMQEAGIGTVVVGCDIDSSLKAVELAEEYPHVWAIIGVHPTDTQAIFAAADFDAMRQSSTKVVGIGECGLDYYRIDASNIHEKKRQEQSFVAQIEYALLHDLPLMLHVRAQKGTTDAHDDALAILSAYSRIHGGKLRGTSHFFTASTDIAKQYLDIGFHISFPGVITFAPELAEVIQFVPIDRILVETDSPYAAPIPLRGTRNDPRNIVHITEVIARIKQVDRDILASHIYRNTQQLFRL